MLVLLISTIQALQTPDSIDELSTYRVEMLQSWRNGDIINSGNLAISALEHIESSECTMNPDAAYFAFVAGVASSAASEFDLARFYFWVSDEIISSTGMKFPDSWSSIVENNSGIPGENPGLDMMYLSSSYFSLGDHEEFCLEGQLKYEDFEDPVQTNLPVFYYEVNYSGRRVRSLENYFSYPEWAESQVENFLMEIEITSRIRYTSKTWIVLNPCYESHSRNEERYFLCRDDLYRED